MWKLGWHVVNVRLVSLLLFGMVVFIGAGADLFGHLWVNMGYVALMRKQSNQAEQWFRYGVQTNAHLVTAWHGYGESLFAEGEWKEALQSFDTALTLSPNYVPSRLSRANVRQLLGDRVGAADDWRALGSAALMLQMGHRAWQINHDADRAIVFYQIASELAPSDWTGYYYLASILRAGTSPRLEEAQTLLETSLLLSPDNMAVLLMAGENEYALARYDQACRTFSRYIQLKADDFLGWYWRGLCEKAKGSIVQAIEDLRMAATLNLADPNPHFQLALLLEQIGEKDAALAEYQVVLKLLPNHAESLKALERLKNVP